MEIKYEIVTTPMGNQFINATFANSDKVLCIPMDESNSDYQAYLKSLNN